MHTSPLAQPGVGDAGGMNVYLGEVSRRIAERGVAVEIFTKATSSTDPDVVELAPGVLVRHVPAGPLEADNKEELQQQLCTFAFDMLRTAAGHDPGHYDVIHSHYWLSGQVGRAVRGRWGVPMVHTAHTLARVKNVGLDSAEQPEPADRITGEDLIVADADALIANTDDEATELVKRYEADAAKVFTVPPGVDATRFHPGPADRAAFGLDARKFVVAFVGRLQHLKGPDVLLRAVAELVAEPGIRQQLAVVICGGTSGDGHGGRAELIALANQLGVADLVTFLDPLPPDRLAAFYRTADVLVMPSRSESFGLVAVEAQASGVPVVAADVGGLRTAVADRSSGLLVDGAEPSAYATAIRRLLNRPRLADSLAAGAIRHAAAFSWERTADGLLAVYRDVAGWKA